MENKTWQDIEQDINNMGLTKKENESQKKKKSLSI